MTESQSQPAPDPAELAKAYAEIAQRSSQIVSRYLAAHTNGKTPAFSDELGIAKAFYDMMGKLFADPAKIAETQMKMWQDYSTLWHNATLRFWGLEAPPVIEPAKGDRRFKHDDWQQNFLFDYIKQSYLIAARNLHQMVGNVKGLDENTSKKVDFYTRQYIDALSPTNYVATNPEVLRMTVESGGQNLVRGLEQLAEDMEKSADTLNIRMTDTRAFRLGENIATTPGKVVFRNRMICSSCRLAESCRRSATLRRRSWCMRSSSP